MEKTIEKLLDAISDLVAADGPWQEKRDAVRAACNDDLKTNLEEFISWFPEE